MNWAGRGDWTPAQCAPQGGQPCSVHPTVPGCRSASTRCWKAQILYNAGVVGAERRTQFGIAPRATKSDYVHTPPSPVRATPKSQNVTGTTPAAALTRALLSQGGTNGPGAMSALGSGRARCPRLSSPAALSARVRKTVAARRQGALRGGGGGTSPPSNASLAGGASSG